MIFDQHRAMTEKLKGGNEKNMTETDGKLGGWDEYINNFLKADDLISDDDEFVCVEVEPVEFDERRSLRLHLERDPDKFLFDLNKTNANFLKNAEIKEPKKIVGKILTFRKVTVNNPKTKTEVESLRIKTVK